MILNYNAFLIIMLNNLQANFLLIIYNTKNELQSSWKYLHTYKTWNTFGYYTLVDY